MNRPVQQITMSKINEVKIVEIVLIAPIAENMENMMMRGINGRLNWVFYVGTIGNKKVYQVDHEWLYGEKQQDRKPQRRTWYLITDDNGEPRNGTIPIELMDVDIRVKDPRPHRPYFVWKEVRKNDVTKWQQRMAVLVWTAKHKWQVVKIVTQWLSTWNDTCEQTTELKREWKDTLTMKDYK